ncbi:signal transduction histidine kinase [Effusibacillus lacus]|nr:signal transduction histidine kinase [Effusibacillus lacus]
MLRYWTTRYLVTLFIGLLIIGIISTLWIRYSTIENRLDTIRLMAEEITDRVVDTEGNLHIGPFLPRIIEKRQRFLHLEGELLLIITDKYGIPLYSRPDLPPTALRQILSFSKANGETVDKITIGPDQKLYLVKNRIEYNQETLGWVHLVYPEKDIPRNTEELQLLGIMLGSLALLGWAVIYLLTSKLSKPIQEVAGAAKQIVAGNYEIRLEKTVKEKEVYELIHSFKEMAERLQQLESLRTELLAGVTHELKTPVASISGLIQAVKDGVVTGEEAKEFLNISLNETGRLQKMVEDLLHFNSFAVGAMTVQKDTQNMNRLIQEIIHQWLVVQDDNGIDLHTWVPENTIYATTDAMRIQQILINLLNNAKQATGIGGKIDVILYQEGEEIRIDVKDNGIGIPEEEQPLIFERFFRGKDKKYKVRGLGLGLPLSKMIAKTLGGDLVLKESSETGTTFSFSLPK